METKICSKCKEEKSLSAYHKDSYAKDGKSPCCKNCHSLRKYGRPHNEIRSKYKSIEFEDGTKLCTKCNLAKPKDDFYFVTHKNCYKSYCKICENNVRFKRIYNLSDKEFDDVMLRKENNKCEICGNENANGKQLHLDHNHDTGKVRGVLCTNCNLSIGLLKEDIDKLEKIIYYLKRYNKIF